MATLAERSQALTASLDIRGFLDAIECDAPTEVVHVTEPVAPARFGVTLAGWAW
jgi:hypothetical protein